jgi:hypothetical protein
MVGRGYKNRKYDSISFYELVIEQSKYPRVTSPGPSPGLHIGLMQQFSSVKRCRNHVTTERWACLATLTGAIMLTTQPVDAYASDSTVPGTNTGRVSISAQRSHCVLGL